MSLNSSNGEDQIKLRKDGLELDLDLDLVLPRFHGHLIVAKQGIQDAPSQSAISSAMEPADDRFGSHWAQAQRLARKVGCHETSIFSAADPV